jgi:hypothetical protein
MLQARPAVKSCGGRIYLANRTRRKGHELRPLWQRRTHAEKVRKHERRMMRMGLGR